MLFSFMLLYIPVKEVNIFMGVGASDGGPNKPNTKTTKMKKRVP